MKAALGFLRWIFTAIGAAVSIVAAFIFLTSREKPMLLDTRTSPDGKFKVMKFEVAGGGGISPFCIDTLEVAPIDAANEPQKGEVFSADCSAQVSFVWASPLELKVTYLVNPLTSLRVHMRASDASQRVKVTFAVTE